MAVMIAAELQIVRLGMQISGQVINYTKPQINAAAQAVEDFITNNAAAISTAVNAATTPLVLTAAQKKALGAWVVYVKYLRDK